MAKYARYRHITYKLIVFLGLGLCLGLLISPLSFAQSADSVLTINDFSKGLVTLASDTNIEPGAATSCQNVRFGKEVGSIVKRNKIELIGNSGSEKLTSIYRIYLSSGIKTTVATHGDQIDTLNDSTGSFTKIFDLSNSGHRFSWLTWQDTAIGCDGYSGLIKYNGSAISATKVGSCLAVDAGSGSGPNGTYTYKITFCTTSYEVSLNTASNSVTVTDNDINLSMIPLAPTTYLGEIVLSRKVYRISNGGTDYKLLSNGTISNNSATTLTDSDSDAERSATTLPTTIIHSPPQGKYSLIFGGRLFIAGNPTYPSRIYWSELNDPDVFLVDQYFDVRFSDGDNITFLKSLLGKLCVGKENSIQYMNTDGNNPLTEWSISDPYSSIGCRAPYSVVNSEKGLIYLGNGMVFNFNGVTATPLGINIKSNIQNILASDYSNAVGALINNQYYLSFNSQDIGSAYNNATYIYDSIVNSWTYDNSGFNSFAVYNSGTDSFTLLAGDSSTGKLLSLSDLQNEVIHNKSSDFLSGTFDHTRIIPERVGGLPTSPILEISRTGEVNDLTGIINNLSGSINLDSLTGTYISPVITVNAGSFDKVYWNEDLTTAGANITVAIRTGSVSVVDGTWSAWSSEFSDSTGSDISTVSANIYCQYRISFTTPDYQHQPYLYTNQNYLIKITYSKAISTYETAIDINWQSGWIDFGSSINYKLLREIIVIHEGSSGTLNLKFENFEGDSDTFAINLANNPTKYQERFTGGALRGQQFKLTISNNDINALKIKKILVVYNVEPL